uniref:RNase H type-1 domain-containing protein n=1 Tax=Fagus sylvatica TaxID=28930 RepID=A0A2N9FHX8_FAGSY
MQALTANVQELVRQSAADRREMQELAKQNQELMALFRSRGEISSLGQGQNGEEVADPTRSVADARAAKLEEELKEIREQMKEMKSQVKAKAAKNLDILVHRTESPFTKRVDEYPLPTKFKVPQLETFDGFKDPLDYLDSFRTVMRLQGVSDEIMCRAFPTNLRGSARTWFNQLETGSIDTSYVQRFNKEAIQIDEPNEYVAFAAFNAGLRKGDFLFQLCKDPPKSMSELMYETQKFINAEDAFEARDEFPNRKRKESENRRFEPSRSRSSKQDYPKTERKNVGSSSRREERTKDFTPLNMSIDQVLLQIQDDPEIKWSGKLRSDPARRSKDLYCRFHRDHGHTTEDCYALKQQIEALIRQGKLGKFVRRDNKEACPEPHPPKQDENKDHQGDHPRDIIGEIRTIVGGLASGGIITRRVLIDNGSSVDIIYLLAYQQMKIDKERLSPIDIPLVGFTGDKVKPSGVVSLIIEARTFPKQVRTSVEFLVVDCLSAYNVIIGRPTLNKLRVVTSTYHLLVRFPTEHGIGELRGDQATARECYFAFLGLEATHQTMKIDEGHRLVEPTEELEKRRVFAPNRNQAISDEVEKLLTAGFIREVYYPDWLANVVVVKKANGKWRMCVDFTDLNKACPKDSFPLPRIDQLVDSAMGHKLLTFMDAFSGYNQIMMDEGDQQKTSFITSKGQNVEVYIDGMLVKTKDEANHLEDLEETFETLRQYRMKLNPSKCVFGVSSEKFLGFMVSQRRIEANPDKIKAVLEMTPPRMIKETLRKAFIWTDECQKSFEELKTYLTSPPLLSPLQRGKTLFLYLAVSPTAVSSALIREEGNTQLPVYYTSKAFQGAEERYPAMEKLALALVITARKLRPYFQSHRIVVLTNHPLRKAMNKPDAVGRLIQWAVELSEFDIEYRPRQAIKAQALADFIAEFTVAEDEPIQSDSQLIVGQVNGEYEAKEERMAKYLKLVKNAINLFDEVTLVQVPREQNTEADALAKLAFSDEATNQYIEVQYSPSHMEEEVSPIDVNNSWMTPITNYLEEGTLPLNPVEAKKLKVRSARFTLIQGTLYKRGFSLTLRLSLYKG